MDNLQLVLTGGKGTTTDLTVFLSDSERALFVYLGVALLERVDSDPNQIAYKILLGRLVNAGIRLSELQRKFKHDPRTMKQWAEALKSNDPDLMVRAFSGRGCLPKVVGPMIRMVKMRYLHLRETVRNYRQIIAREVKECFGETVSRETLRQLFVAARVELEAAENAGINARKTAPSEPHGNTENLPFDLAQSQATACSLADISSLVEPLNDKHSPESDHSESLEISAPVIDKNSVKKSSGVQGGVEVENDETIKNNCCLCSSSGKSPTLNLKGLPYSGQVLTTQLCAIHHAGQVLFSPWFDLIGAGRPQAFGLQSQWIGQILQAAVNIEQSQLICDTSLSFFTGPIVVGLRDQRDKLKEMATAKAVLDVYKANNRLLLDGPGIGKVFYYDPHSKECATQLAMLKGWCGRTHTITKVLHLDFIHTESGLPCFLQHYDNYYDLRERFFMTLSLFGDLFPRGSPAGSTFVLDRGIFGHKVFAKFRDQDCYLITWEKGYQNDGWDKNKPGLIFHRYRERNHAGDTKKYSFECQEAPWPKDPSIRRIIVRATNPSGRIIQVAVLCNHPEMQMERIVTLLFNRWIQENSFQYLDRHFGLLQITSYASENYKDIEQTLVDRWVDSPEYRELKRKFATAEQELAKLLLKRERKSNQLKTFCDEEKIHYQALVDIQKRIKVLLEKLKVPKKSTRLQQVSCRIRQLRAKHKRIKISIGKLQDLLSTLDEEVNKMNRYLEKIETDLDTTLRQQSRLKILIDGCYQRPDIQKKSMMDALRISAHNMFQEMMKVFRPIYGNYRNDHVMLRALTRSDGFIWRIDQIVYIRLWLEGRHQPHKIKRFQSFLKKMENFINGHFRGRAATVNIEIVNTTKEVFSITKNHGIQIVTPSSLED
jgi:hypothetical protein